MRRIQDGIQIGNARHARDNSLISKSGIAAVIDLAMEERPVALFRDLISLRIPLHDGDGNSAAIIQLAVKSTYSLLAAGIPCLVACSAGLSRSPLIAAAAISLYQDETINKVLQRIAVQHPLDVSPILLRDVSKIVDELNAADTVS